MELVAGKTAVRYPLSAIRYPLSAIRYPLSAALVRWALLAPFYNAPAGRHHNPLNPLNPLNLLNLYPWPIRGMIEPKEAGYDYGIHGTAWRDGLE